MLYTIKHYYINSVLHAGISATENNRIGTHVKNTIIFREFRYDFSQLFGC